MKIDAIAEDVAHIQADVLVVPVHEGAVSKDGSVALLDRALGGVLNKVIKDEGFTGRAQSSLTFHTHGRIPASKLSLVGIGKRGADSMTALRVAASRAARAAQNGKSSQIVLVLPTGGGDVVDAARAAAEGLRLGSYRFDR